MKHYVVLLTALLFYAILTPDASNQYTGLYNSRVVRAQRYERPLASSADSWIARLLGLKHSGVVVTLQNGQRWLVHKGNEYGQASQTLVTRVSYMSSAWSLTATKNIRSPKVGDYVDALTTLVAAGGIDHNILMSSRTVTSYEGSCQ